MFAAFTAAIFVGTALLMLPASVEPGQSNSIVFAIFTATSAVCVTGLAVVDTGSHWSTFGEVVILVLCQIGSLGIITLASLLGLLVARRFGLRMRISTQTEMRGVGFADLRKVVWWALAVTFVSEVILTVILTARLMTGYDRPFGDALYSGVFHAISSFTAAGFSLHGDSLSDFVTDPWVCLPITLVVIAGSLGFPVLMELSRGPRGSRRWTLHTKITVLTTVALLFAGFLAIVVTEWSNTSTMDPLSVGGKLLSGFFASAMTRSAGLNTLDVSAMRPETLLVQDVLMFIGGGSAGTAGGIKVTTFALLAFVMIAEIRGEPTVHVMGRRLPSDVQRQALTIALLAVGVVTASTITLLAMTDHGLDSVLFETISAFGTVGLSAGITGDIPPAGQLLLAALMFIGRLGPITAGAALALRKRPRKYELPEERPIVG